MTLEPDESEMVDVHEVVLGRPEILALTTSVGEGVSPLLADRLQIPDHDVELLASAGFESLVARGLVSVDAGRPVVDPMAAVAGVLLCMPDRVLFASRLAESGGDEVIAVIEDEGARMMLSPLPGHVFRVSLLDRTASLAEVVTRQVDLLGTVEGEVMVFACRVPGDGTESLLIVDSDRNGLDVAAEGTDGVREPVESLADGVRVLLGE
jgi:hypothetical protein